MLNALSKNRSAKPVLMRALAVLLFAGVAELRADIELPAVFSDRMVLQAQMPVPVWGWAAPGEEVTVTLADQTKSAVADKDGQWRVTFGQLERGAAVTLTVSGKNTITVKDLLVGEVWLASGQSNMAINFAQGVEGRNEVLANANDPWIRQFTVKRNDAKTQPRDAAGVWRIAYPKEMQADRQNGFSAVGYFFARELRRELNCPVAVINASIGATPIQAWSPKGTGFENMVRPLAPYAIRGLLWYQGESNLQRAQAAEYPELLRAKVAADRELWGQGEIPFYFVQIAPFLYSQKKLPEGILKIANGKMPTPFSLPEFWEAQAAALKLIPNSGMVVINDSVKDLANIHPPNKLIPGKRLALLALANTYDRKDVVASGPVYQSMNVEGIRIRIKFHYIGSGLTTRDGKAPTFLEIAGEDRKFVPATGEIEGESLLVSRPEVPKPVAVRFAWTESALPNLMNKEGLPARSFRTDRWPVQVSAPSSDQAKKKPSAKRKFAADSVEKDARLNADGPGWSLTKAVVADPARPRVLLIGDSILNGYRQTVIDSLQGEAYVDTWTNPHWQSAKVNTVLAEVLTEGLTQGRPYDVIHANMGLHGWPEGRIKPGTFEPLTKAYIEVIRKMCPNAKIIWASSTPVLSGKEGVPNELDPVINANIQEQNRMAAKVMAEMNVPINDLYALVIGKLDLAKGGRDKFHWTEPGRKIMGEKVVKAIREQLANQAAVK
jgi:sialate O-acetylesterase